MRRPTRTLLGIVSCVVLLLGACSSDSESTPVTEATLFETIPETIAFETTIAPDTTAIPSNQTVLPIVLRPNGVSDLSFGDDADTVVAQLTELLGPPIDDSGWQEQQAPCDNMGSRSRSVTWETFNAFFATGPTEMITEVTDHFSAYLVVISEVAGEGLDTARFVLDDGAPALGRTIEELQTWKATATRFESEIEGPVWVTAENEPNQISGSLITGEDGAERTASARAGLFCID
jgi:hypothetical protein